MEVVKGTGVPVKNRIASVFVHVTDLERSAQWYSRLFGIPVLQERLGNSPVYWLELQGTHLILDTNRENRKDSLWREDMKPRFMLAAADIREAYQYLKERAEIVTELRHYGTMANFCFRGPDGEVLMVCWSANRAETAITSRTPLQPKIGGIFLDVKDIRASARWYSDLLGVPYRDEDAHQDVYSVPVSGGGALLLDRNRHQNGEAFSELFYLETDRFDEAVAFLCNEGFQLSHVPSVFPDLSEVGLLDPDGNRLLVAQVRR